MQLVDGGAPRSGEAGQGTVDVVKGERQRQCRHSVAGLTGPQRRRYSSPSPSSAWALGVAVAERVNSPRALGFWVCSHGVYIGEALGCSGPRRRAVPVMGRARCGATWRTSKGFGARVLARRRGKRGAAVAAVVWVDVGGQRARPAENAGNAGGSELVRVKGE